MKLVSRAVYFMLAALLLNFISLAFADQQSASNPALWKLEHRAGDKLSTVYLFGSVHFGKENFYPMAPSIESAYGASDILAVEVDVTKVNPQTMLQYASLPADKTLKTVLEPKVYQQLSAFAQSENIPVTAFDRFQPWFVGVQIMQVVLMKSRFNAVNGVDMHLLMRRDRPVEEIESIDTQMQMFAGMSDQEQNVFLQQTLSDMRESEKYINLMMTAWRQGDLKGLNEHIIEPMKVLPGGSQLYQKVFVDRNRHMVDVIEAYLNSGKTIFYTVGLGHYAGDDSILVMLKQRGYKPQRVN